MATGTRQTNTMAEGLRSLLASIADLKTTPDANLNYLIGLETALLQEIRRPIDELNAQQGQSLGMTQQLMGGNPGGGMGMPCKSMGGMPPTLGKLLGGGMGGGGGGVMQAGPIAAPPGPQLPSLPMQGNGSSRRMPPSNALPPVDELRRLLSISGG